MDLTRTPNRAAYSVTCLPHGSSEAPNVVIVHYDDPSADLEGEMRRIAARLGITVPEATWPGLMKAATHVA